MENVQESMKELFGNACYCYCLEYLFGNKRTVKDLTKEVVLDWYDGYLDNDGYVSKPLSIVNAYGFKFRDIKKPLIDSLSDLPNDNYYIVEYRWGTKQHFVVANKNGIVFDPSGDSNTVKNGKPFSYRLFIL